MVCHHDFIPGKSARTCQWVPLQERKFWPFPPFPPMQARPGRKPSGRLCDTCQLDSLECRTRGGPAARPMAPSPGMSYTHTVRAWAAREDLRAASSPPHVSHPALQSTGSLPPTHIPTPTSPSRIQAGHLPGWLQPQVGEQNSWVSETSLNRSCVSDGEGLWGLGRMRKLYSPLFLEAVSAGHQHSSSLSQWC